MIVKRYSGISQQKLGNDLDLSDALWDWMYLVPESVSYETR